jgi:hypothetical protein
MTLNDSKDTLTTANAPDVAPLLIALWHDARGDWQTAHAIAQDIDDENGAWVHAYLHRKEGDRSNARYWYRRAQKPEATDSLDSEWTRIVSELL